MLRHYSSTKIINQEFLFDSKNFCAQENILPDNCTKRKMYKQWPPFGAKICSDICPRTLSVPWSDQKQRMSKGKYPSMFSCQMKAIVLIILQIFFATRAVWKIGEYLLSYHTTSRTEKAIIKLGKASWRNIYLEIKREKPVNFATRGILQTVF